uniref:Cation:proton antiporter n=1 Tax=Chryseobacterium endophyticum TaxID=1854762 RepID=A0AAU6WMH1_9FLAO
MLAVVAGGLLMSYNSHCYLSHTSRIQSGNVWSVLIFLMNTIIFILIGLELPVVVAAMKDYTISEGIIYSIVIGGAIIGTRILYSYALMYFPRLLSKEVCRKNPKPDWREPFIISFAAMRVLFLWPQRFRFLHSCQTGKPFRTGTSSCSSPLSLS